MSIPENLEAVVRQSKKIALDSPLLIAGFAGAGLVGSIAAGHIIEQLNMKEIAYVRSKHIPPAAVFEGGRLRHPFRIHVSPNRKVCVALCEVPLRSNGLYHIASALIDWAEKNDVKEIVVIDGFPVRGIPSERKTLCAAEQQKCKALREKGVETLEKGFIMGMAGSIINECLIREVSGTVLLATAATHIPDPEGAASLIESLNRIYGLNIDVKGLRLKGEKVKERFKGMVKQFQRMERLDRKKGAPEHFYA